MSAMEVCALHPRALLTESVQQHLRVGGVPLTCPCQEGDITRLREVHVRRYRPCLLARF